MSDKPDHSELSNWFSKFGFRQNGIDFDALNQFVVSLRSELDVLVNESDSSDMVPQRVIDTINEQLGQISKGDPVEQNWNRAYHAEKLLLVLYSNKRVEIELLRRLDRSERINAPFTPFYIARMSERKSQDSDDSSQRDLLVSLVGDLQWQNSHRYINMRYARLAIYKVGTVFVISFAMFLTVLSLGHWS